MNKINKYLDESLFEEKDEKYFVDIIKSSKEALDVIEELKLSDYEIYKNFIQLKQYISHMKNKDSEVFITKLYRDEYGNLEQKWVINDNEVGKLYKLENFLMYSNISSPVNKVLLEELNLSKEHHSTWTNLREEILESIEKKQNLKGSFITGDYNSNRSNMLSAIANTYLNKEREVAYINLTYLEDKMKSNFNSSNYENNSIINKLSKVDVLIFDELGYKKMSSWFAESVLSKILEERNKKDKITYFGSYFDLDRLSYVVDTSKMFNNLPLVKLSNLIDKACDKKLDISNNNIKEKEKQIVNEWEM